MSDPTAPFPNGERMDGFAKRLERLEGQVAQLRAEVGGRTFFEHARRQSSQADDGQ